MVKPGPTLDDIRKQLQQAGFEANATGAASIEVRKYNCVHRIERNSQGLWAPASPAHFLIRGLPCELEDHGYQKFWLADGKRFPIRLDDLKGLHRFDQEVRYHLHLKSLYNDSLGSTCARSAYDRVDGRPDA
ncbi:MAG TPA: hypothetical protein VL523_14525 [Terriglobia bacterium]|nr:hypothetical protein [Terriglobia bacterium]